MKNTVTCATCGAKSPALPNDPLERFFAIEEFEWIHNEEIHYEMDRDE